MHHERSPVPGDAHRSETHSRHPAAGPHRGHRGLPPSRNGSGPCRPPPRRIPLTSTGALWDRLATSWPAVSFRLTVRT